MRRAALLLGLFAGMSACFPNLPDETLVDSLRILAVRVDPPTARLDTFPPPVIRVSALTVDPADPTLSGATHRWTLDLPDDVDAGGLERLLPKGEQGPSIELDLGALAERDTFEWSTAVLPLRYRVETPDDHREAVKLVRFLVPRLVADDDDSAGPSVPPILPEPTINELPRIISLVIGDRTVSEADLPRDEPLDLGPVGADGLTLDVHVADDGSLEGLTVQLFRTAGCPNLPPEAPPGPLGPAPAEDGCGDSGGFGAARAGRGGGGGVFGGTDANPDYSLRTFEWRPEPGQTAAGVRLFLVLRDDQGAQTWVELRPTP